MILKDPMIQKTKHPELKKRNRFDKTQLMWDISTSEHLLEDYKENILKVKTYPMVIENAIDPAIEELLQLASTMKQILEYIAGMISTDSEHGSTSDLSESSNTKRSRSITSADNNTIIEHFEEDEVNIIDEIIEQEEVKLVIGW